MLPPSSSISLTTTTRDTLGLGYIVIYKGAAMITVVFTHKMYILFEMKWMHDEKINKKWNSHNNGEPVGVVVFVGFPS